MVPVCLASISPYAGKNAVALGMACKFRDDGKKVGYFKPIGPLPVRMEGGMVDEDAVFFKKVLNLCDPLDALCPVVLDDETVGEILRQKVERPKERILTAFKAVSEDRDIVLAVSMGRLSSGRAFGYSMRQFVEDVKAKLIVVDRYRWPMESMDGLLLMKEWVGDQLAGVVFNHIPRAQRSHVTQAVEPFLATNGIPVLGVLGEDRLMNAVPLQEIVDNLDGRVLCGGDRLDELAENFCIGAMTAEAALRIFRRVPRKAVITGGDRPDIHLAALETDTRCLILTGDLYPNERILARADAQGVPVILVSASTSRAAEVFDWLRRNSPLHNERKVARAKALVEENLHWDRINDVLGIA